MLSVSFEQALPTAIRISQVHSAAAVRSGRLSRADRDDVVQEALIASWRALPHFDSSRATLGTFLERVVANRVTSITRSRRFVPFAETADIDSVGSQDRTIFQIELRSDVSTVLNTMSDSDRQLALALSEYSPSETSRKLKLARSTVYKRINNLRDAFLAAGLVTFARRLS